MTLTLECRIARLLRQQNLAFVQEQLGGGASRCADTAVLPGELVDHRHRPPLGVEIGDSLAAGTDRLVGPGRGGVPVPFHLYSEFTCFNGLGETTLVEETAQAACRNAAGPG